ncbi:MAG: tetrahydrofolate dehydrogenase/cyclohydrolase catalytic domain-containing protein [Thermoplasmataceae archaeon]
MTTIFDGKGFSANVDRSIEKDVSIYKGRNGRAPKLYLISTASSQDQESYIKSKIKKGARIGVEVETIRFDETSGEEEIIDKIEFLNESDSTDGIMVESPVRQGLNAAKIYSHISGRKDVDSQNPLNLGLIMLNKANRQGHIGNHQLAQSRYRFRSCRDQPVKYYRKAVVNDAAQF